MRKSKRTKDAPDLFANRGRRPRRALILPRYLTDEASKTQYRGKDQDAAFDIVKHWADLEFDGHLAKKETALNANFLLEIFGEALGYKPSTQSPEEWRLERNYSVPGIGTADGALGNFSPNDLTTVVAVIELKAAGADLDRDKFNGRRVVQQCWDYLNALPNCPWGIVSNFVTTRLYHRDKTPLAYEEFRLQDLRRIERFREFYCLLKVDGLLKSRLGKKPRALELLERTENRQRQVGDELYEAYSENRHQLIGHLMAEHEESLETTIHIAQKILDRIVFVAFCEDRELLPEKCIEQAYQTIPPFSKVTNPRWRNFLNLFQAIDKGHDTLNLKTGYDGGLFRHDPQVDDLELDDSWTNFFRTIGNYDFRDEVNVEVLGHIFEKSITDLEKLRFGGLFASPEDRNNPSRAEPSMKKSAQRKRFFIYYPPPDFTHFIVSATVGAVIDQRFDEIRTARGLDQKQVDEDRLDGDKPRKEMARYWRDCLEALRQVKICDPACGSGAFLIQAYEMLEERYTGL